MGTELRPGTEGDLDALLDLFALAFGIRDADRPRWRASLDPAQALVATVDGRVAAASHVRPFHQWFGRPVAVGGFSPVAVYPQFRGRGLARAVTAGQFERLAREGMAVSGLFPASLALYRALGFEVAGSYVHRRLTAAHLASMRPDREVVVRRGGPDDVAAVKDCYARTAARRPGAVQREAWWWDRRLPADLADTVLFVVDGPPRPGGCPVAAYAAYRTGRADPPYDYSVVVSEVVADDPDHLRALWRVVASSGSQAPHVEVIGPAEDDLFLVADQMAPDAPRSETRWMLRLVDLPAAMAARGWPAGAKGTVELDVRDGHVAANEGRWVLEVGGGEARLTPGGTGRVCASIGGLASWWAGYATASRLARTGHLDGPPEALAVLDALLPADPPVLVDFY
jgi:predicted acetyltransferase